MNILDPRPFSFSYLAFCLDEDDHEDDFQGSNLSDEH